ncbi:hypothetical protein BDV10DRAFT_136099 [Aspergillus recurvatus]
MIDCHLLSNPTSIHRCHPESWETSEWSPEFLRGKPTFQITLRAKSAMPGSRQSLSYRVDSVLGVVTVDEPPETNVEEGGQLHDSGKPEIPRVEEHPLDPGITQASEVCMTCNGRFPPSVAGLVSLAKLFSRKLPACSRRGGRACVYKAGGQQRLHQRPGSERRNRAGELSLS